MKKWSEDGQKCPSINTITVTGDEYGKAPRRGLIPRSTKTRSRYKYFGRLAAYNSLAAHIYLQRHDGANNSEEKNKRKLINLM